MHYLLFAFIVFLLVDLSTAQAQSRFKSNYLKNVDEARTRAIAGTLVPIALGVGMASFIENNTIKKAASFAAVYGLVLGPSFGNFYAKDYLRGMLGVAARVGGSIMLLDATRELAGDDVADGLGWDDESVSLGDTKVLIGSGIILGSAIYNIISSKASVNRFNKKTGYLIGMMPAFRDGQVVPLITAHVQF